MNAKMPTFFIPHGGGPCFFMPDPSGVWTGMRAFLESLPARLPRTPSAILVVSGHWETKGFAFTGNERPGLIYDYSNFPPHTYQLVYAAAGAPDVAVQAASLLLEAGIEAHVDSDRGWDHGVFIPLMVAFPNAEVPVVEMSVEASLDPLLHVSAGRALATLRDAGVLILGSGMSFHNMRGFGDPRFTEPSSVFDGWLGQVVEMGEDARRDALARWANAPAARLAHPAEEHLLPLMVAAGASRAGGRGIFREEVLSTIISGFEFPL